MSEQEKRVVNKVMHLLRLGRIDKSSTNQEVYDLLTGVVRYRVTFTDGVKREYKTKAQAEKWAQMRSTAFGVGYEVKRLYVSHTFPFEDPKIVERCE